MNGKGDADAGTVEARCLAIYERVLGVSPLAPDAEFAEAGGESMHAVLIATELENDFGVELPMATFYQYPTVAEMAAWLRAELARGAAGAPGGG
jgi:acyl carrier protein